MRYFLFFMLLLSFESFSYSYDPNEVNIFFTRTLYVSSESPSPSQGDAEIQCRQYFSNYAFATGYFLEHISTTGPQVVNGVDQYIHQYSCKITSAPPCDICPPPNGATRCGAYNQQSQQCDFDGNPPCPPNHTLKDGQCVDTRCQYSGQVYLGLTEGCSCPSGEDLITINGTTSCQGNSCTPSSPDFQGYITNRKTGNSEPVCSGKDRCPAGQTLGYVNGIATCVSNNPCDSDSIVVDGDCDKPTDNPDNTNNTNKTETTTTQTNSDGTTVTTTTTTTTKRDPDTGQQTTEKTTTTKVTDENGNVISESTVTDTTTNDNPSDSFTGLEELLEPFFTEIPPSYVNDLSEESLTQKATDEISSAFDDRETEISEFEDSGLPLPKSLRDSFISVFGFSYSCRSMTVLSYHSQRIQLSCDDLQPLRQILGWFLYVLTFFKLFEIATAKPVS